MSIKTEIAIVACLVIAVVISVSAIKNIVSDSYYRGVYEECVRSCTINGHVTEFDLLTCKDIEINARAQEWHTMRLQQPIGGQ